MGKKEKTKFKDSLFVKFFSKFFLKETTIQADGKIIKGLSPFAIIILIVVIVSGACVLEWVGVIDDIVSIIKR